MEIVSLIFVSLSAYLLFIPLFSTYDEKYDKFGNLHIPPRLGALYLLGPTVLLAILFHPYVFVIFLFNLFNYFLFNFY